MNSLKACNFQLVNESLSNFGARGALVKLPPAVENSSSRAASLGKGKPLERGKLKGLAWTRRVAQSRLCIRMEPRIAFVVLIYVSAGYEGIEEPVCDDTNILIRLSDERYERIRMHNQQVPKDGRYESDAGALRVRYLCLHPRLRAGRLRKSSCMKGLVLRLRPPFLQ